MFSSYTEGEHPKINLWDSPKNKCSKDLVVILSNILYSKRFMWLCKRKSIKKMDKCPSEKKKKRKK
jgi:hypothetical protein